MSIWFEETFDKKNEPLTTPFGISHATNSQVVIEEVTVEDRPRLTYADKQVTALKIKLAEADAVINAFIYPEWEKLSELHYQALLLSWMMKSIERWDFYPKGA